MRDVSLMWVCWRFNLDRIDVTLRSGGVVRLALHRPLGRFGMTTYLVMGKWPLTVF